MAPSRSGEGLDRGPTRVASNERITHDIWMKRLVRTVALTLYALPAERRQGPKSASVPEFATPDKEFR
jgi:hypothetical protein